MTIKLCTKNDISTVTEFYDSVTLHLTQTVNYPKWTYKVYPSAESVTTCVNNGVQYACFDGDRVVGAFVMHFDVIGEYLTENCWQTKGKYLTIHTLATHYNYAQRGIASQMVRYAISYARQHGCCSVRLDVVPTNTPACRLYLKHGFVLRGESGLNRGFEDIPSFYLYELVL